MASVGLFGFAAEIGGAAKPKSHSTLLFGKTRPHSQ